MNKIRFRKRKLQLLLALLLLLSISGFAGIIEFEENPAPTHVENNYKKLTIINEISADFDENYFLAMPSSITADEEGNIYIFDRKLQQIFKFSKDYKFIKTFGKTGKGPMEYDGSGLGNIQLYSSNNLIYLSSAMSKKILVYNTEGKCINEIAIPEYFPGLIPIVNVKKDVFLPSKQGAVDVFNPEMQKKYTLLDKTEYRKFVTMKPFAERIAAEVVPNCGNTAFDIIPKGGTVIYIFGSSTLYRFDNEKLIKKFSIIPKEALKLSKTGINKIKKMNPNKNWIVHLFNNFFMDKDNYKMFYLDSGINKKGQKMLYRFDLDGKLLNVLYINKDHFNSRIIYKKNGVFLGITLDGDVKIMKEEEQ